MEQSGAQMEGRPKMERTWGENGANPKKEEQWRKSRSPIIADSCKWSEIGAPEWRDYLERNGAQNGAQMECKTERKWRDSLHSRSILALQSRSILRPINAAL